jgi:hypothetical protein
VGEDFVSPWLCIGDLNFVMDQTEKLGCRPIASSSHCPFRNFIDHLGLVDLGFVGTPSLGATTVKVLLLSKKGLIEAWLLLIGSTSIQTSHTPPCLDLKSKPYCLKHQCLLNLFASAFQI